MGLKIASSRRTVAAVASEARLQGSMFSDFGGDCSSKVDILLVGYPDDLMVELGLEKASSLAQHILVRCRKCPECLAYRGRVWTARAVAETLGSVRTWFGTLTLAPERALQARMAADSAMTHAISDRTAENHFQRMVDFVNPEITRFLKRVRKNSDARLRYLLVAEAHKSGMPHWHILLHEHAGSASKRELEAAWRYGFSHWRLVQTQDPRAARYACKYLSKTALARVRASKQYGSILIDHLTERLLAATRVVEKLRAGVADDAVSRTPVLGEPASDDAIGSRTIQSTQ